MREAVAASVGAPPGAWPPGVSPVLAGWMGAWEGRLGAVAARELARYVEPLAQSRGSEDEEMSRRWLVIDWLLRFNTPRWLRAGRVPAAADRLAGQRLVGTPDGLTDAVLSARDAVLAANEVFVCVWDRVRNRFDARTDTASEETRRRLLRCWGAITRTSDMLVDEVATLLDAARTAAIGGPSQNKTGRAVDAAGAAIREAVYIGVWSTIDSLTVQPGWRWTAEPSETFRTTVREALVPVEQQAQASAHRLVQRLLDIGGTPKTFHHPGQCG